DGGSFPRIAASAQRAVECAAPPAAASRAGSTRQAATRLVQRRRRSVAVVRAEDSPAATGAGGLPAARAGEAGDGPAHADAGAVRVQAGEHRHEGLPPVGCGEIDVTT